MQVPQRISTFSLLFEQEPANELWFRQGAENERGYASSPQKGYGASQIPATGDAPSWGSSLYPECGPICSGAGACKKKHA
jgi:hypothetical protein